MEISVGIIKSKILKKEKKIAAPPTQFWKPLVKLWFDLYAELLPPVEGLPAKPIFDTIESFQYKIIVREIKKRAEERNIEWNEQNALTRTEAFLRKAWEDDFVSKNFMLRIISNNKSKIFNNQITPKKNGSPTNISNNRNRTTSTSDSKIRALAKWGLSPNKGNDKR